MENEPKVIIFEFDMVTNVATLMRLGDASVINGIAGQYEHILSLVGLTCVVVELDKFNLSIDEQKTICDYVLEHTLNKNVDHLVVGVVNEDENLANSAIQSMLK